MVDCVVCRYWSERLDETPIKRSIKRERRLLVALRTHQFGACARRFPGLLRDLVKQELESSNEDCGVCDPARARMLTGCRSDEFGAVPTTSGSN